MYEGIKNDLFNSKTDKEKDRVIIENLIGMANSLSCGFNKNNININFF